MKTTKRMIAALMAALVIMTTTYNACTVSVNAASVVIGGATVSLVDLLVGVIMGCGAGYMGKELIDRTMVETDLRAYLNTTEGTSALKDFAKSLPAFTVIEGGGGSDPEPPEDPDDILDTKVSGLASSYQLYELISGFFDYVSNNDTAVGSALAEATNQDITYVPFPSNFHFSSVDNPVFDIEAVSNFQEKYPEIVMEGNYFLQIRNPDVKDTVYICPPFGNEYSSDLSLGYNFINLSIHDGRIYYQSYDIDKGIAISLTGYGHNLIDDTMGYSKTFRERSEEYTDYSDIYICGNVRFRYDEVDYVLNPDGNIYQVVDGQPDQLVIPHISTAEGCLTSAKPIVGMDISALISAIGKAITEAYPDEAPVLTPEAINQIYENTSNYYDQAVNNYYNNPQTITENEYITNITNIYEQAIADNPAVDNPVQDPAIPISPTLGNVNNYKATGLSEVFPFCIPFDMYDLMTILVAEPEAISFDCTLYFGPYLGEYTLTIDLSVFDPVAKVVRTMELLLYMFGLMLITRSLIRG